MILIVIPNNVVILTGTLISNIKIFKNHNGSYTASFLIGISNSWTFNIIKVHKYVQSSKQMAFYQSLKAGRQLSLLAHIHTYKKNGHWIDKNYIDVDQIEPLAPRH